MGRKEKVDVEMSNRSSAIETRKTVSLLRSLRRSSALHFRYEKEHCVTEDGHAVAQLFDKIDKMTWME